MTTMTARDFNRDVSAAKRAAEEEPVIITDRGRPSHVLMTIEEYERIVAPTRSALDWLAMEEPVVDFDPQPMHFGAKIPEL
ncbi:MULTISPECIES: type II toxin-antitoxin system Phd/YefM family antitoxin [Mumia]|uniref:type II toxin-antitoxin system Phd/YefM family antitoxin n=1 Tax=Mumia TaxID=1546255 RepID=UPI0014218C6C|nr:MULTISPECIES: type II toxin-antitoxin system Phd/YefM family antitoxin [unclassified Mumia]QMW66815.1 type II toxin-antitoxin system Phd/YefM family antitoxin [Mumia sp. ZJ1417]